MAVLSKGANCPIPTTSLVVRLSWSGASEVSDVDLSALLLDPTGTVRTEDDFIFFNQPRHASGAVAIRSAQIAAAVELEVELTNVEPGIERVLIAGSLDGCTFGAVHDLLLTLSDATSGEELIRFEQMGATTETALVAGELYRRAGAWKFRAIGQGWASGLAGLATDYGISVEDDSAADEVPSPDEGAQEGPIGAPGPPATDEASPSSRAADAGAGSSVSDSEPAAGIRTLRPIVDLAREVRARFTSSSSAPVLERGPTSPAPPSSPAIQRVGRVRPVAYRPPGNLWPSLDIVGESHYKPAIQRTLGRLRLWEDRETEVEATLVPEPTNRYDKNAVAVQIDGAVVGYLSRDDARLWKPVLDRLRAVGATLSPRARVWGSNRPVAEGGFMGSVRLALPHPSLTLPLNAPPAAPHSIIPWGSRLKLSGAPSATGPLARHLSTQQEGLLLVGLRHRNEVLQNGSERVVVEAVVHGSVVGSLTPASSRNIVPAIQHLQTRGLEAVGWVTIRGSSLAVDLGLQTAKAADLPEEWLHADPVTVPAFT